MFKEMFTKSRTLIEGRDDRDYYSFPEDHAIDKIAKPKAVANGWGNYGGPVYSKNSGKVLFMGKEREELEDLYSSERLEYDGSNSNMWYLGYDVPGYINQSAAGKILDEDGKFIIWRDGYYDAIQDTVNNSNIVISVLKNDMSIVFTNRKEKAEMRVKYNLKKNKYNKNWTFSYKGFWGNFVGPVVLHREFDENDLIRLLINRRDDIQMSKSTAKKMSQEEFQEFLSTIL